MFFGDEFVNEVLERNDIVDVLSQYMELKKKGNNYWGLCPFHGEKTPSFSVNSSQQFYYCFGCHAGGNVIGFIQKQERMDFVESVTMLADRIRLDLPKDKSRNDKTHLSSDRKSAMYNLMKESAKWYYNTLNSDVGKNARGYIRNRGLSESIVKRFGLGFAKDDWRALGQHMLDKGVDEKLLLEVGLAKSKNDSFYDTFRNRVMFPIIDSRSRVCGFGGRVMDDSQPKYLNSPETPIFNKSYMLYGLHTLHKQKSVDKLLIVEGYMDVISLHKAGYRSVVASLGTALTQGQAKLMKRYCQDVYICYDGDGAGQAATLRGLDILRDAGLNVRVMTMPDGMDPDDYANQYGLAGIEDAIDAAKALNDFKINVIEKKYDLTQEEQRMSYLRECSKIVLAYIDAPIEMAMYVKRLHMQTGFPELAIHSETDMAKRSINRGNREYNNRNTIAVDVNKYNKRENMGKSSKLIAIGQAQTIALSISVYDIECRNILRKNVAIEDFITKESQEAAKTIYELGDEKKTIAQFMIMVSEDVAKEVMWQDEITIGDKKLETITECIKKIKSHKRDNRTNELLKLISDKTISTQKRHEYMREIDKMNKERVNVDDKE